MSSNNKEKQENKKNSAKAKSRGKSKKRVKKKEEIIDTTVPIQKNSENNNSSDKVSNFDLQIPPYGCPNPLNQLTQLSPLQMAMLQQQYFSNLSCLVNQSDQLNLNRSNAKIVQRNQQQLLNLEPVNDANINQSNQVNRYRDAPMSANVAYCNNMRLLNPINSTSFNHNLDNDLAMSGDYGNASSKSFDKNYLPPENKDQDIPVNDSNDENDQKINNKNKKAKRFKNELYPISSGKIRVFWKGVYHKRKNKKLFSPYAVMLTASTRTCDNISKREREYVCEKCEFYIGNMNAMCNHVAEEFVINPFGHPLEYLKPHISLQQYLLLKAKVVVKEIMNGKNFEIKEPNKKNIFLNELVFSEHTREYIDGFFKKEFDKKKSLICCRVNPEIVLEHLNEIDKYTARFRQVMKEVKWCHPYKQLSDEDIMSIDFKDKRDINLNYDSFHPAMFTIHGFNDEAVKHIMKNKVIDNQDDDEDDEDAIIADLNDDNKNNNDKKDEIPRDVLQNDLPSNNNGNISNAQNSMNNISVPNSINNNSAQNPINNLSAQNSKNNNSKHPDRLSKNYNIPDKDSCYIGEDGKIKIKIPDIDLSQCNKYKDYDQFVNEMIEMHERYMKKIISHKDFDKYIKKSGAVNNSIGGDNKKDDAMDLDDTDINAPQQIKSHNNNRNNAQVVNVVNISNSNKSVRSNQKITQSNNCNDLNIDKVNPNQYKNKNIQIPQIDNNINNPNAIPVINPVQNSIQKIDISKNSQNTVNNMNQYPPNYIKLPDSAYPINKSGCVDGKIGKSVMRKNKRNCVSVISEDNIDKNDDIGDTASVNNDNDDVPKKLRDIIIPRNETDASGKPKSEIKSNIFSLNAKNKNKNSNSSITVIEKIEDNAENDKNDQNDNQNGVVYGPNYIKIKLYSTNEDPDNMPLNNDNNMLSVNDDEDNNGDRDVVDTKKSKKKVTWVNDPGDPIILSDSGDRNVSSKTNILSTDNVNNRINVNKLFSGDKKVEPFSEDKNIESKKLLNNKRERPGKKKKGKKSRKSAKSREKDIDEDDDNDNEDKGDVSCEKDRQQDNNDEEVKSGGRKCKRGKGKKKDVGSNPRSYKRKKYDNDTNVHSNVVGGDGSDNEDDQKNESPVDPKKSESNEIILDADNNKKRKRGKKK